MKDYRLIVKIKNNRLLRRIEDAGYRSTKSFSDAFRLDYELIIRLLAMKASPTTQSGAWRIPVIRIADALSCNPDDLFNDRQMAAEFSETTIEKDIDEPGMFIEHTEALLIADEGSISSADARNFLERYLPELDPKGRRVLTKIYGLDGDAPMTLEAIGAEEGGVTRERIRQIEWKAINRIRKKAKLP